MRPAVFLDRDGTMIEDTGYLSRLEDLVFYPWTIDAIRLLNRAGFLVFVTTNQGGVGLGYYPETFVHDVHRTMTGVLEAAGARVDGWFYCPHHPNAAIPELRLACECRKPNPGMVQQAQRQHAIDLAASFVVGDKATDVALAPAVGARGVLVRTGEGEEMLAKHGGVIPGAAFVATDLMQATAWMIRAARESGAA